MVLFQSAIYAVVMVFHSCNNIEMRAIGDNDDSHSTFYYTDKITIFSG